MHVWYTDAWGLDMHANARNSTDAEDIAHVCLASCLTEPAEQNLHLNRRLQHCQHIALIAASAYKCMQYPCEIDLGFGVYCLSSHVLPISMHVGS